MNKNEETAIVKTAHDVFYNLSEALNDLMAGPLDKEYSRIGRSRIHAEAIALAYAKVLTYEAVAAAAGANVGVAAIGNSKEAMLAQLAAIPTVWTILDGMAEGLKRELGQ